MPGMRPATAAGRRHLRRSKARRGPEDAEVLRVFMVAIWVAKGRVDRLGASPRRTLPLWPTTTVPTLSLLGAHSAASCLSPVDLPRDHGRVQLVRGLEAQGGWTWPTCTSSRAGRGFRRMIREMRSARAAGEQEPLMEEAESLAGGVKDDPNEPDHHPVHDALMARLDAMRPVALGADRGRGGGAGGRQPAREHPYQAHRRGSACR